MKLSTQTVNTLTSIDFRTMQAFEEVRRALLLEQSDRSPKRDTEFETIWNMAELEGRKRGVLDFLGILSNPKNYERTKADQARDISQET